MGWMFKVKRFNLISVLLVFVLIVITFAFLILGAGSFLTISQNVNNDISADLITILGGDAGARSIKGLQLFQHGKGKKILLTGIEEGEGITQPHYLNWRAQYLISSGVNKDDIYYDTLSKNSWDEAQKTLLFMKQKKLRSTIVVSDPPHQRRLKWIWDETFNGSGLTYYLIASKPSWWNKSKWWDNELSTKFVATEYLKILYYYAKY